MKPGSELRTAGLLHCFDEQRATIRMHAVRHAACKLTGFVERDHAYRKLRGTIMVQDIRQIREHTSARQSYANQRDVATFNHSRDSSRVARKAYERDRYLRLVTSP